MRTVAVIVLLILILGFVGWVQFSSPDGSPTLRVDTEKVKQDTSEIFEKTKDAVNSAAGKIDESIHPRPIEPVTE